MEKSRFTDHFTLFPYRKEVRDNGDVNNGGIDLIKEPHRINEIHELADYPWLKDFVLKINEKNGYFMTFGCVCGPEDGANYGYIDFSLRPTSPIALRESITTLDDDFHSYLGQAMQEAGNPQEAIKYVQQCFVWEWSPLEIYGETYKKVTVTFAYLDQSSDGIEWAIDHLQYFLTTDYPLTHQCD